MDMSLIEVPVHLERLVCKLDGAETKFLVARNSVDGTFYGKPARTLHIIPHDVFFRAIDDHLRSTIKPDLTGKILDTPVIELPRSGARLIMVYFIKHEPYTVTRGKKELVFNPCIFAINAYDGLVSPRIGVGLWKTPAQFSSGLTTFNLKPAKHDSSNLTSIANVEGFTFEEFTEQWDGTVSMLQTCYKGVAGEDAEGLIKWLTYSHIMLNNKQQQLLTELWSKVEKPTWLHRWEACTYVLNQGKGVESCFRLGKLFFRTGSRM